MDTKPIRTEADYEAALKEVENLMDSQPGTPEGDRLDVLVTLIEAYEAKHFPIPEPAELLIGPRTQRTTPKSKARTESDIRV